MKNIRNLSISGMTLIILVGIIIMNYNNSEKKVLQDEERKSSFSSSISMMLETDISTGVYEVSSNSSWPSSSKYEFNSILSSCENGSSLSWDNDNDAIVVSGNVSDKCYIYFDVRSLAVSSVDECEDDNESLVCYILKQYTTDGENNLYYHDGQGSYTNANLEAGDYSYRYSGGDYELTDLATDAGYTTITNASSGDTTGFIDFYCNDELSYVGYYCAYTYYYLLAYDSSLTKYYTYEDAISQAIVDGYLNSDNLKNFVCFGDDCSDIDNLYRIVGLFKNEDSGEYEVKLVKYSYASSDLLGTDGDYGRQDIYDVSSGKSSAYYYSGSVIAESAVSQSRYYWNKANYSSTYSDTGYYYLWSYSKLNTINLNTNFLNNIGNIWSNLIATHSWNTTGNTWSSIALSNAYSAFISEIISPLTIENVLDTYNEKIGLLYVSDYYYSAYPEYWSYAGNENNIGYRVANNSNWSYMGVDEYFITYISDTNTSVFSMQSTGFIYNGRTVNGSSLAIRPTFYLKTNVTYSSGSGTIDDPIILQTS